MSDGGLPLFSPSLHWVGKELHEPTSPPVRTDGETEKDVKTKQGIQKTCTMCIHIEPHTMHSAIDTYKCCYTVGMHYTSVLVHVSCCGNMHMRIPSTTLT